MQRKATVLAIALVMTVLGSVPAFGEELSRGQALRACAGETTPGQFISTVRRLTGMPISSFNFVVGDEGDNNLIQTPGVPDILCGLEGEDSTSGEDLEGHDVFFGGPGADNVGTPFFHGVFVGGPGDDFVIEMFEGTAFYGGPGNEYVDELFGGHYFGEEGSDVLGHFMIGGEFHGGEGDDVVGFVGCGGIENICDVFDRPPLGDGTFFGGAGNDRAFVLVSGAVIGGPGDDEVVQFLGGICEEVETGC